MENVKGKSLLDYTSSDVISSLKEIETISELMNLIKNYGEKTAISDVNEYSFSNLDKKVGELRYALKNAKIAKGDTVGVLFQNSFDFVASALAIMSYGSIAVLLPYHLDEKTLFGCSLKYALKAVMRLKSTEEKTAFMEQNNQNVKIICIDEVSGGYEKEAEVSPESGAAVCFTAGTTGQSKGVLLSHKALTVGMRNGIYGYEGVLNQRYFLVLPLTHIFGLVRNLLTSLYTGSSLYICRDLKEMFREMSVYKPTLMVMVPALAEMALNMTKMMSPAILGGELKTIICGAAVVTPYLAKEYKKLGVTLCAGYGLTETANLVSGNPETVEYPESVGLLYPKQEYKIVDGELWIKGDNLFSGYFNDPDATAEAFEDGYFKTGDLVRFDDEGRLYITGRCKEIIVLSTGENVSPAEIEARFCELECIQDALIYLEKDGNSEKLVLEVLPRMTVLKQKGVEDVDSYCREKIKAVNDTLYDYQKINKIIVRKTDFERTPSMKIKRPNMI